MPDATWPDFAQALKNVGTSASQIPQRQEGGAINFPIDVNATASTLTEGRLMYSTDGHMYFCDGEAWIQLAEV
jgi:hypothetical protein